MIRSSQMFRCQLAQTAYHSPVFRHSQTCEGELKAKCLRDASSTGNAKSSSVGGTAAPTGLRTGIGDACAISSAGVGGSLAVGGRLVGAVGSSGDGAEHSSTVTTRTTRSQRRANWRTAAAPGTRCNGAGEGMRDQTHRAQSSQRLDSLANIPTHSHTEGRRPIEHKSAAREKGAGNIPDRKQQQLRELGKGGPYGSQRAAPCTVVNRQGPRAVKTGRGRGENGGAEIRCGAVRCPTSLFT